MSAAFWKGLYHAMLVAGVVLLFTEHWALGVGLLFGVVSRVFTDAYFRRRERRMIAYQCAELTFSYQAVLVLDISEKHERGETITEEETRKQRFWVRSSIRYLTLARGQHPFRTNKRST